MASKLTDLSIVIIAGNESTMIADCLASASFARQVILVAANSQDDTVSIAKKVLPRLIVTETRDEYNKNFSKWRNLGSALADSTWIFHLDADERISPSLKSELQATVASSPRESHFAIPRANYFLGRRVRHGGTYPDYVIRLFRKSDFKGHIGFLHEQPQASGSLGYLKSDLVHYTHRRLDSMVSKSIAWTDMEAHHIFKTGHPAVVWWRFIRMMLTKLWERLINGHFWRDGTVGFISSIFEMFDTFMIYARLYELQKKHENRHL